MHNILLLFVLIVAFATFLFSAWVLYTFVRSGFGKYPPAFPSFGNMNKVMLKQAREVLSASDTPLQVVDLGCGDGRVLKQLAQEFPKHNFTGYEWDRFVFKLAKIKCRKFKNISLYRQDFMKADISQIDLIILFCGNEIAKQLSLKIAKEAKPKAKIISEAFKMYGLDNEKEYSAKTWGFMPIKVYTYQVKTKIA